MTGREQRRKKGFTLVEVLIVVAIIAVVLAISIPAVMAISKNLEMTKLDQAAKEIYTVVQNRLTAIKASGELVKFDGQLTQNMDERNLYVKFHAVPSGFPSDDESWQGFYYLLSDDALFHQYIVSDGTTQAFNGQFVVELNPETGDVFSVFYGEFQSSEEIKTLYEEYAYSFRSRDDRMDVKIGYYSGSDLSVAILPKALNPRIQVFNQEELYLKITCPDILQFAATRQYMTLTLTLTDQHNGKWEKTYNGLNDLQLTGSDLETYVLLDSMERGKSFAQLTGLAPGDQITAVAKMTYSYRGKNVSTAGDSTENVKTFSSLFDSVADTENGRTLYLSKLRHLNNLRQSIYQDVDTSLRRVVQSSAIDFDASSWSQDAWCPTTAQRVNPLTAFAPIEQQTLLGGDSRQGIASFEGGELRNMVIGSGGGNTGVLAYSNCDLSGFRLIDPQVAAGSYSGTLVGRAYGGSISNCGVYLTTSDANGIDFEDSVMTERTATYAVSAGASSQYVGGLVGFAQGNTTISQCFAALNVTSEGTYAGGFIGGFSGASITDSYSSGDVAADGYAGGFAASLGSGNVQSCYSTSYVTAQSNTGGFVGTASGGQITGCNAYGATRKQDGTIDLTSSGPFIGTGAASLSSNAYLRQNGYNSDYDDKQRAGVEAKAYALLTANPANDASNSFPYVRALKGTAFPFVMVNGAHYGNWPQEATLETSLVYYEKYVNNKGKVLYGYYADGYANTGDQETASSWNLNTLLNQDQLDERGYWLTEDGYAIMSIYNLVQVKYSLNDNAVQAMNVGGSAGSNTFVLMENPASLPLTTMKDGQAIGTFSVKYLYIYQLPFTLQETNRNASYAFYDKLKMTGYAKGNLATAVFTDYTFYYCPHFAKNAVNPDVKKTTAERPQYPDELVVYVRSPRQLNALGRYSYYWNRTNNTSGNYRITFSQEVDLDFSKYTKTYCGRSFDLMSTDAGNIYRNRPIGRPVGQKFYDPWGNEYSPGSFQNVYDGNGYKIIDYRQYCYAADEYQFSGLFGEVKIATMKDIVMAASDPANASGYVINEYNAVTGRSPGTGALVGLSYAENKTDLSVINNCAVSGYTVKYVQKGKVVPDNIAVGGLIGYNMGVVSDCFANTYLVAAQINDADNNMVHVSGLIGGITNGTVTRCYAGGSLELTVTKNRSANSTVNGITGYSYVWDQISGRSFSVTNSYSYCVIAQKNGKDYAVYGAVGNLGPGNMGSASGNVYMTEPISDQVTVTTKSGSEGVSYTTLAKASINGMGRAAKADTYPWNSELKNTAYPFPAAVKDRKNHYVHYGDWPVYYPQAAYLAYFEVYEDSSVGVSYFDEKGIAVSTLKEGRSAIARAGYGLILADDLDYPITVTADDGEAVTLNLEEKIWGFANDDGVAYSLKPLTGESAALLMPKDGRSETKVRITVDVPIGDDQVYVIYAHVGFANALLPQADVLGRSGDTPLKIRTPGQLAQLAGYTFSGQSYFALTNDLELSGVSASGRNSYGGKLPADAAFAGNDYVLYGAALPIFEENAGAISDVQSTDAQAVFVGINQGTITGCTITGASVAAATGKQAVAVFDNQGTIKNTTVDQATLTLTGDAIGAVAAASNSGTLSSVSVRKTTVTTAQGGAIFAYENSGLITGSQVTDGQITASAAGAGLVYHHSQGKIEGCFVENSRITGQSAAGLAYEVKAAVVGSAVIHSTVEAAENAYGFAYNNESTITGSYVAPAKADQSCLGLGYDAMTVQGANAFGFVGNSMGSTTGCFTVAKVTATAGKAAGFANNVAAADQCYSNSVITASAEGAGFAFAGTNISGSYVSGAVSASTAYGFMHEGSASNCYSIAALTGDTMMGFGPDGLSLSNCYWVRDTKRSFNMDVSGGSGQEVSFYQLGAMSGFTSSAEANPFTDANGSSYPYTLAGTRHMGDWAYNPAAPEYIGVVKVVRTSRWSTVSYSYTYCGYNEDGQMQVTDVGPKPILNRNGTYYFIYTSQSLSDGWDYSYDGDSGRISNETSQTDDGYTLRQINFQNNKQLTFSYEGAPVFTVRYSDSTINFVP